jgi:hypothetical protein
MRTPINVPIELVKPFVQGKVFEYFCSCFSGEWSTLDIGNMKLYTEKTLELVIQYLAGKEVLDARASDAQCSIAMDAYSNFKMFKEQF